MNTMLLGSGGGGHLASNGKVYNNKITLKLENTTPYSSSLFDGNRSFFIEAYTYFKTSSPITINIPILQPYPKDIVFGCDGFDFRTAKSQLIFNLVETYSNRRVFTTTPLKQSWEIKLVSKIFLACRNTANALFVSELSNLVCDVNLYWN
ncbi:hypothetical protein B6S12_07630 [Helicobacter valdiviensis]|uniref:Uncharacterized protein n=1 Tax=Helicobacter valdiviensis TaxID=1458358 RepID=A0A2W6PM26_9HELI|nr:hypothetical protein [Helicobacter valdiviensis]PZT47723.1 hypothetical protein B6S12_07630 [Helicobacter valdiviensis]